MSSTVWQCRICGRRIPLRVDECFCGAKREQVVAQEKREADRSSTKIPLDVAFLVVLVVLVGVAGVHYAVRSDTPPEAAGRNLLSGVIATPDPMPTLTPPPIAQAATPVSTTTPSQVSSPSPEPDPSSLRVMPLVLPPSPSASPSASPSDSPAVNELEQRKTAGLAAYSAELDRLAATSHRMAEHTRAYQSGCVGQNVAVQYSNCPEMEAAIRKTLGELEQGLDAAEEQARRSWVEPGKLRDARARTVFGKRDWEEMQRAARQVGR